MRISDWSSDVCSSDLSMVTALAPLIAPPIAGSPTPFETGRDSPVNIASLKPEAPSRMLPSTGTLAPGRTSTWSPGIKAERSEEHTSELQSLMRTSYAVFCLKTKNKTNKTHHEQ